MRSLATSRMAGSPSGPSTANISRTLPEPRWVRPENSEAASGTGPTLSVDRRTFGWRRMLSNSIELLPTGAAVLGLLLLAVGALTLFGVPLRLAAVTAGA